MNANRPTPVPGNAQTRTGVYQRYAHPTASNFVKLEAGEVMDLTCLSAEPVKEVTHWIGGRSRGCTGPQCPFCLAGDRPRTRWTVEVETPEGKRTWDLSNTTMIALEDVATQVGTLQGLRVRVTRQGTGYSTSYLIAPLGDPVAVAPQQPDDVAAMTGYIKTLCANVGLNPRDEVVAFLQAHPDLQDAGATAQLNAFIDHLEALTATDADHDAAAAPKSAAEMF